MLGTVLAAADDVDGAVAALIARGREVAAADRAAGRPTTAPDWLLPRRTVTVGLPQVMAAEATTRRTAWLSGSDAGAQPKPQPAGQPEQLAGQLAKAYRRSSKL